MSETMALPATALCRLLGCRAPLVLAGMGGVARSQLVAAVSAFGGFGFLGMVREPLALIRREVQAVRALTDRPFGVNLIPAATPGALLASQVDLCIDLAVPAVELFWDVDEAVVGRLRAAGITVVHQVGSAADALRAEAAGAHAVVAQGVEAGGHVWGRQPLVPLLAEVLGSVGVPVAAAGGLADGCDVARVLALGAQAAVLGTALIATDESFAHDAHKQRLVAGRAGETLLTEDFHVNWPPHAAVRVLANSVTRGERGDPFTSAPQVIGDEEGRPIHLFSTDSPLRSMTGDFEAMALYAGRGVDHIDAVVPAAERLARIEREAAAHLRLIAPAPEPEPLSSPVCYAAEMQQAWRTPLVARLGELLARERAGARALLDSGARTPDPALRGAIGAALRSQTRMCALLVRALQALDAVPDARGAAAHPRAAADAGDVRARLSLYCRGAQEAVGEARALLAQLEGAPRAELLQGLDGHEAALAELRRHGAAR